MFLLKLAVEFPLAKQDPIQGKQADDTEDDKQGGVHEVIFGEVI